MAEPASKLESRGKIEVWTDVLSTSSSVCGQIRTRETGDGLRCAGCSARYPYDAHDFVYTAWEGHHINSSRLVEVPVSRLGAGEHNYLRDDQVPHQRRVHVSVDAMSHGSLNLKQNG